MTVLSTALNAVGAVFLLHAVYSSYEHSLLNDLAVTAAPQAHTTRSTAPLPTDIIVELLISVLLLCVGLVVGSTNLKPIKWNLWASEIEHSKNARKVTAFGEGGGNPYARLEDRVGFLDVRKGKTVKK